MIFFVCSPLTAFAFHAKIQRQVNFVYYFLYLVRLSVLNLMRLSFSIISETL